MGKRCKRRLTVLLVTYFEKLISNIQPSQERIEAVAEAHKALRTHLLEDADLKYPASDSFLSGSYARHTAVDPIKDVDVIVLLDHDQLGSANPQPRAVLEDYKQAIDAFYEKVDL